MGIDAWDVLGLAGVAADLGEEEIDTEGGVLVVEVGLELADLVAEHVGGVANATEDTHATGVCDGGRELGPSSDVHAGEEDGVVDAEEIGDRGADLLCGKGVRSAFWSLSFRFPSFATRIVVCAVWRMAVSQVSWHVQLGLGERENDVAQRSGMQGALTRRSHGVGLSGENRKMVSKTEKVKQEQSLKLEVEVGLERRTA